MMKLVTPLAQIDSSALYALGSKVTDKDGNEYIYLLGVASTVAGDAVTYNGAYATARVSANGKGPVAFAMAAIVAAKYGWYQVRGLANGLTLTAVVTGMPLYLTATAGQLDDAVVAGDLVANAFAYGTGGTNAACTFEINYPFCTDTLS
jgi:hypothetical protein